MRHNMPCSGRDGEFQNEVIVHVSQNGPPAKADAVLVRSRAQVVQSIFDALGLKPQILDLPTHRG